MALVEAARYHTLSEAHVAAALLRSAGIPASLSDTHYGSVFWLEQKALGGFRISVPEQDLADTISLLDVPPAGPDPEDEGPEDPELGRRGLAVLLMFVLGPAAGWLVAQRRRFGPSSGEVVTGALMSLGGLVLVFGGLVLVAAAVIELLTNPP